MIISWIFASHKNAEYFDNNYENMATEFLKQYDNDNKFYTTNISTVEEILNDNFTVEEIEYAIDCLKTNKTPGLDSIPAEFIKACKHVISPTIATVFNYIIEHRDFPETWSCGTRSGVFKSGKRNIVDNFRGITILPIMEKIFEAAVYKRIVFVNEAFEFCDRYNNGFLEGSRTSDNLFMLSGLVERQYTMNKRLYVCYITSRKHVIWLIGQYCFINWSKMDGKVELSIRSVVFLVKHIFGSNEMGNWARLSWVPWVSIKVESQAD